MRPDDDSFAAERPRLMGLAYRMLGSVGEAEDVVQDCFLRWHRDRPDDLREAAAWLTTVTVRLCLDQLRAAKVRRDAYVGPWLPEPLATADDDPFATAAQREDLSLALLLALEALSPRERAVFLLHDVFDYDFAAIAAALETREDNCRQLASRARRKLKAERPALSASRAETERLLKAFTAACLARDIDSLKRLLAEDVVLLSDGGGKAPAALNPIHGADHVARFFASVAGKTPADLQFAVRELNGAPALVADIAGVPQVTIHLDVADGVIVRVMAVRNPDKLARLALPR